MSRESFGPCCVGIFCSRLEIQISRICSLSDLHLRPSLIRGTSLFFSSTLSFKKSVWVKPQSFNAIVPTRLASLFRNEEPVTGQKKLLNAITNIIATNACVTIKLVASATGAFVGLGALAVGKVDCEFKRESEGGRRRCGFSLLVLAYLLSLLFSSVQLSRGNYMSLKTTTYAGVSISSEVAGSNTSGAVRPLLLGGVWGHGTPENIGI